MNILELIGNFIALRASILIRQRDGDYALIAPGASRSMSANEIF
jgi:hypothetical protein